MVSQTIGADTSSNTLGVWSNRPSGEEGEIQDLATGVEAAKIENASLNVWGMFIRRLNDLYKIEQKRGEPRRIGKNKKPINIVKKNSDRGRLERFAQTLPPVGRWASWERCANLFSVWIEDKAIDNLNSPLSVFIANAKADHGLALEEWEASHPTMQFRELPPLPDLTDPRVVSIVAFTENLTGVFPSKMAVWNMLQTHDAEIVKTALIYHFQGWTSYTVVQHMTRYGKPPAMSQPENKNNRELKSRVRKFFADNYVAAALNNMKISEDEERERESQWAAERQSREASTRRGTNTT